MNTPSVLLAELTRRGVELWAEGERLRYRAPRGAMAPELFETLRAHKAALLEVLRDVPRGPCYACGHRDWWRRPGGPWTCAVCHPPAVAPVERVTWPEPAAARAAEETATPTASGRSPPDPL